MERFFEERNANTHQIDFDEHLKQKSTKEEHPEWQQTVRSKKGEDFYSKLKEVLPFLFFFFEFFLWNNFLSYTEY